MDFHLTKEQQILQQSIQEFTRDKVEPIAGETDRNGCLPDQLIERMVSLQIPGMCLPAEYGGSESSLMDNVVVIEQLSYSGSGAWWYAAFGNSIPDIVNQYGTSTQKAMLLKPVCDGQSVPSIQFTEASTGSDPQKLETVAVLDGDRYQITGSKRFSTFGGRSGFAVVFAKDEADQCTAFIVDKQSKGYTTSSNYQLMGSGGIEAADVFLDHVSVPTTAILGNKGEGFQILLNWIAEEKIQQCAACVGIAQAAIDEAVSFARSRQLRMGTQAELPSIQFMIAEMYANLQAARYLTYRTASLIDSDENNWKTEASACKVFVVPATMTIVEQARRIIGAYAYTKEYKIERLYRAIAGASAIAVSLEINKSIVGRFLLHG